jgi:hypothetical protein
VLGSAAHQPCQTFSRACGIAAMLLVGPRAPLAGSLRLDRRDA